MRERGPHRTSIVLNVNGRREPLEVEPRCTLLDALRLDLGLTGSIRCKKRSSTTTRCSAAFAHPAR